MVAHASRSTASRLATPTIATHSPPPELPPATQERAVTFVRAAPKSCCAGGVWPRPAAAAPASGCARVDACLRALASVGARLASQPTTRPAPAQGRDAPRVFNSSSHIDRNSIPPPAPCTAIRTSSRRQTVHPPCARLIAGPLSTGFARSTYARAHGGGLGEGATSQRLTGHPRRRSRPQSLREDTTGSR